MKSTTFLSAIAIVSLLIGLPVMAGEPTWGIVGNVAQGKDITITFVRAHSDGTNVPVIQLDSYPGQVAASLCSSIYGGNIVQLASQKDPSVARQHELLSLALSAKLMKRPVSIEFALDGEEKCNVTYIDLW